MVLGSPKLIVLQDAIFALRVTFLGPRVGHTADNFRLEVFGHFIYREETASSENACLREIVLALSKSSDHLLDIDLFFVDVVGLARHDSFLQSLVIALFIQ